MINGIAIHAANRAASHRRAQPTYALLRSAAVTARAVSVGAATVGVVIAAGQLGCHEEKTAPTSASIMDERLTPPPVVNERPLPSRNEPTLVKQGSLPLVYLNELPATLRFVDVTERRDLGVVRVAAQQIVSFDAKRGVVVAGVVVAGVAAAAGALDANHVYGIFVEPDQESVMRSETGQVKPPPRPRRAQPPRGEERPVDSTQPASRPIR